MNLSHKLLIMGLGFVVLGAAGCGDSGPKYVKVTGVVTLDGKPYKNAAISFQPVATSGNMSPGRGSSAFSDENGKFVLKWDDGEGAVVGKHLIRIATKWDDQAGAFDPTVGSPDGDVKAPARVRRHDEDPIPAEWNTKSERTFDVPPGGTDKANFDITSAAKKKKK